jgi:hypothetical protein
VIVRPSAPANRATVTDVRFNHMELTFPRGELTDEVRADINRFYGEIFGWKGHDVEILKQRAFYLPVEPEQFILIAESDKPISSPGYDHLGLLQDTRSEVDDLLAKCKAFAETDDRVRIKEYTDLVYPTTTVHAFYVKYLLPIWFDVQVIEHTG